jgi:hypothetical protein
MGVYQTVVAGTDSSGTSFRGIGQPHQLATPAPCC